MRECCRMSTIRVRFGVIIFKFQIFFLLKFNTFRIRIIVRLKFKFGITFKDRINLF